MINYACQGGSADMTKAAMIRFVKSTKHAKLILAVHDELVCSCPIDKLSIVAEELKKTMCENTGLDVPVLIDIESGNNWGDMSEYR
jgi:DNA polymerase-1